MEILRGRGVAKEKFLKKRVELILLRISGWVGGGNQKPSMGSNDYFLEPHSSDK